MRDREKLGLNAHDMLKERMDCQWWSARCADSYNDLETGLTDFDFLV